MKDSRRNFIKNCSLLALGGIGTSIFSEPLLMAQQHNIIHEPFKLPQLPYSYDALDPAIDKMTMEIHHGKHHKSYVDNLNKATEENNIHASLEELIANVSKYSSSIRNNGGGHWNHSFFWKIMKPSGGGVPSGKIATAIDQSYGSFENFKEKFEEAGTKRFGSGWAWLVLSNDKLLINSTPNQDNPLMDISEFKGAPLLGIDVWEHAYYLKYQNRRTEYLKSWWNVVNWEEVNKNLANADK